MKIASAALRGSLMMTAAAAFFAIMSALIRLGSEDLHAFQIAFFRSAFGLVFMLPWLFHRRGTGALRTERFGLLSARALVGVGSMLAFFWSLTILPLAQAVSLSFTAPLFVTLGAALLLGEVVRARRLTATLVGFAGTLIILKPGVGEITWPMIVVLGSAMGMAGSVLIVKSLSATESSSAIVTWMVLMMTPLTLIPALFVWRWPDPSVWLTMVALGGVGTAGHILFTRAVQQSDASFIMAFDFMRLPIVAVLGYFLFQQSVDIWTWVGGGIIFLSGIYIAHRESRTAPDTPVSMSRPPA